MYVGKNEIAIQAEQVTIDNIVMNDEVNRVEYCSVDLIDIEEHRRSRSVLQLVQRHWLSNLAFAMLLFDVLWMLIIQIYLTWLLKYSFLYVLLQCLRYPLIVHSLYCLFIYILEKRKEIFSLDDDKEKIEWRWH